MAKRAWPGSDGAGPPDEKYFRQSAADELAGLLQGLQGDEGNVQVEAEFYIEQRLVGWIIGRGGGTLKEIEQGYQVKVTLDQTTKEQGYSKVRISGTAQQVTQAAEHMNMSLARAVAGAGSGESGPVGPFLLDAPPVGLGAGADDGIEELQVEQRFVGWLLGKGGGVIREIEQSSGCKVSMNQETRHMGFSKAQLRGDGLQRAHARQLILESLERAKSAGGNGARAFEDVPALNTAMEVQEEMRIEQRFVGWLVGKGGGVVRETEQASGCRISINQETRHLGYSRAMLQGDPGQRAHARQLIMDSIDRARAAGGNGAPGFGREDVVHASSGLDLTTLQQQVAQAALGCADRLGLLEALAKLQAPPSLDASMVLAGLAASLAGGAQVQQSHVPAAAPGGGDGAGEDMQVEQRWVGWLLGKAGVVLKELEVQSGARISIDQSTKAMGFSTVRVAGDARTRELARRLVQEKISQATT